MRRHFSVLLSIGWLLLVLGVSIVVPMISDTNPRQPVSEPLLSPTQHPPLGTDALGRDVWTRIVHGGRISPSASLVSMLLTVLIGSIAGLIASSMGGWFDRVIVWLSNSFLAIPGLLLAMLLVAAMGPRLLTVILAVGFGGAPASCDSHVPSSSKSENKTMLLLRSHLGPIVLGSLAIIYCLMQRISCSH